VTELHISEAERADGALRTDRLAAAADAVRLEGYVILHGAVDAQLMATLGRRMLRDVPAILDLPRPPHNFTWGNVQHDPPPDPAFLFPSVLYNDFTIAVTQAVLGEGVHNGLYSGNTNLPRSRPQPVHVDTGHLWRRQRRAHPACELVVNLAPLGMSEENGATEIWPGSHLDTTVSRHDASICVPDDVLEARRVVQPPVSAHLPPGSVLIRDVRLWHRGVPNPSDTPRPMVAMIHRAAFLGPRVLDFPVGAESVFARTDLHWPVRFRDDAIDHIGRNRPYDYDGSGPA
jgi:hypothetical protein